MARVPEGTLMLRAAAGLAAACAHALGAGGGVYGARVVVLTGSGDNGGDALYAGARLARRGAGVTAVLLAPGKAHRGGLAALRAAGGRAVAPDDGDAVALVHRADLVLDGIVGIGGKGGLRAEAVPLVEAAHASRAVVVAVDLPSGVDADTGEVRGTAVRADMTVTFGAYKPALLVDPAAEHAGALRLVDIGLGPYLRHPARPGGPAARRRGRPPAGPRRRERQVPARRRRRRRGLGALPRRRRARGGGGAARGRGGGAVRGAGGAGRTGPFPRDAGVGGTAAQGRPGAGLGGRSGTGRWARGTALGGRGARLGRARARRRGRSAAAGPGPRARPYRGHRADPARGGGGGAARSGPRRGGGGAAGLTCGAWPTRSGRQRC